MLFTERVVSRLKIDEGFSGVPYKCPAGATTIAFGRNLDANPLTEEEGEYLLKEDVRKALHFLYQYPFFSVLPDDKQEVLACMVYQLGTKGFAAFKKMLAALEAGNHQTAAVELKDSLYYRQHEEWGSNRIKRMVKIMSDGTIE